VDELATEIDIQEVCRFMKATERGKGAGIDGFPVKFWSEGCKNVDIGRMLTKLIKFVVQESFQHYGRLFIHKGKGVMDDPGNFTGIALLSILSKIYTGVLAKILNDWVERRGTISDLQMGFRKGRQG
jgi:hypothetical protein